ncbi:winged helix-turn-helix transcriptional regulator [Leptospira sp. 'Mane']|uniref:winged helix-turn-helix transcriptional regulator n=1 Tax=Leptospira sp. 'Mane' TaxID=3387407 RepID=UPI00398B2427
MKKQIREQPVERIPQSTPCPPHDVLEILGNKWSIIVLTVLSMAPNNRLRFSDLKVTIEGISQRMLTLTLRNLEREGILIRHFFPEVPPRVEYQLTGMGKALLPSLQDFIEWIRIHWPTIQNAREHFDENQRVKKEKSAESQV